MKQTAGTTLVIKNGEVTEQLPDGPVDSTDASWFDDEELEKELDLWRMSRRMSWHEVEDTEGIVHFYDDSGTWQGSAHQLDESSVDWFLAKHELTDSSDEDDAWNLIDALENTGNGPNRENTP